MSEIVLNKVQKLRKKKNITQQDLADSVGVTRQTIIAIEKGNYTPSVLLAIKISKYFKAKVENVFEMQSNKD